MKSKVRLAAIQASPIYLDLNATVDKAVSLIETAAAQGADLAAFPEAYFPGYPYWPFIGGDYDYSMHFWKCLYQNALTVPSEAISRLSRAARKNNIFVCASGSEKDGGSLYLTQFWFDREGNLMGKHRKVRPTGFERTIWGEGDGSMMPVFQTELGRLGGLQCWEHCMVINNLIMASQNEQIHVAAWPGFNWNDKSIHHHETAVIASKYYALSTGTYTLLTSDVISENMIQQLCGDGPSIYKVGCGAGACIINPAGKVISEIIPNDQEGIAYADIDWDDAFLAESKYHLDIAGHYSKGGVAQVIFNRRPQQAVLSVGENTDYSISYEKLQLAEDEITRF